MAKRGWTLTISAILAGCLVACSGGGSNGDSGTTSGGNNTTADSGGATAGSPDSGGSTTGDGGAVKDAVAPAVSYTTPADHATGVTLNSAVTVTFSEAMDPATINQQTFTINGIAGVITYEPTSKTAMFSHQGLNSNALHTVTISRGVKDLAGNPLAKEYTWTFTTSSAADTAAPTVAGWVPGSTDVAVDSAITAVFNEPMDIASIRDAFTVREEATSAPVPGSVEYVGGAAAFKPAADLKENTTYTANIAGTASDLAGNHLAGANCRWSFSTGTRHDHTAPEIIPGSEIPASGATDVPDTSTVSIAFNEPFYPFLFGTVDGVPGIMSFDYPNNRVTMTPTQKLSPGVKYNATVRAKDLAGNFMPNFFVWTFTVHAAP